jgi:hypothetical protein
MSPRTSTPTVGKTDGPIIVRGIHQHHWPSGAAQTYTQGPTVPLIAATEFVNDIPQVIAAVNADQEETQFALLAALDKLHPLLKRLVLNVLDGADLQEAAAHAGIAAEVLPTVLPRLRLFLRPYVRH